MFRLLERSFEVGVKSGLETKLALEPFRKTLHYLGVIITREEAAMMWDAAVRATAQRAVLLIRALSAAVIASVPLPFFCFDGCLSVRSSTVPEKRRRRSSSTSSRL